VACGGCYLCDNTRLNDISIDSKRQAKASTFFIHPVFHFQNRIVLIVDRPLAWSIMPCTLPNNQIAVSDAASLRV